MGASTFGLSQTFLDNNLSVSFKPESVLKIGTSELPGSGEHMQGRASANATVSVVLAGLSRCLGHRGRMVSAVSLLRPTLYIKGSDLHSRRTNTEGDSCLEQCLQDQAFLIVEPNSLAASFHLLFGGWKAALGFYHPQIVFLSPSF